MDFAKINVNFAIVRLILCPSLTKTIFNKKLNSHLCEEKEIIVK